MLFRTESTELKVRKPLTGPWTSIIYDADGNIISTAVIDFDATIESDDIVTLTHRLEQVGGNK